MSISEAGAQKKYITYVIILFFVIGVVVGGFLYSKSKEAVSMDNDKGSVSEQVESDIEVDQTEEVEVIEELDIALGRKVEVFIDANYNKVKDDSEKSCDECIAKHLVAAYVDSDGIYPLIDALKEVTIQEQGRVK